MLFISVSKLNWIKAESRVSVIISLVSQSPAVTGDQIAPSKAETAHLPSIA